MEKCKNYRLLVGLDIGCIIFEIQMEKDWKNSGKKGGKFEKMGCG